MSKRSKEKKPALADWAFGAVGQRRQAPPIRNVSLSFRREGLVFADAAGEVVAVVNLAPGMFVERVEPPPAAPAGGFEDETRQSGYEARDPGPIPVGKP